jgi:hypothetical protein
MGDRRAEQSHDATLSAMIACGEALRLAQRGANAEMPGVLLLDCPCHRGVHLTAAFFELTAERDLLRRRYLKVCSATG